MKPQKMQTPRLCLRPMRDTDDAVLADLFMHEEVGKTYMVPEFASREEAVALGQRIRTLSQQEDRLIYGVYLEDRLIGMTNEVLQKDRKIEFGYVIHPEHKNRGYATETLTAMIALAFSLGFTTVMAGAFEENRASMRVMEKSGMTPTGEFEEVSYRGKTYRCPCYEITKGTA